MAGLDAGLLDRRIRIERDGKATHDGYQNVPGKPAVLAKAWAQYIPSPGRERYANAEIAATAPALFRIPWQRKLDPDAPGGLSVKDRVRFPARDDGALYEIVSVVEYGRRVGLDIAVVRKAK
ncbi:head-tail adaptor protein [Sphingomonas sp. 3-13AW]|uniref:head-tail adaptor protein n=1 Tax=Sphingomonas sp. 3-13AW TaxID=3050450 RepID=UPI003BB4CA54